MTACERLTAARAFVEGLLAAELKKAEAAECAADLDRAAQYARIDRAIERGEEEPTWTGWTWAKSRADADDKLARARAHLETVTLAATLAGAAMTKTVASLRRVEDLVAGGERPDGA